MLKIPADAESAFRVTYRDAFDLTFRMHLYGVRKTGWFLSTLRSHQFSLDSIRTSLAKGEWRTFVNVVVQARFWELPRELAPRKDREIADGFHVTIEGNDGSRQHSITRFVYGEQGLYPILEFCQRKSGYFTKHPSHGSWICNFERPIEITE